MSRRTVLFAALGLMVSLSSARADYMTYFGEGLTSTVTIHDSGHLADGLTVGAGQFLIGYQGQDVTGYCVDLDHYAASSDVVARSIETVSRGDMIAYLYETYSPTVTDGTRAAALQSAIWECLAETGTTLDVNIGSFSISGNSDVETLANQMLATLPASYTPAGSTVRLDSDQQQDVVVPEPATMGILALGGALMMWKRSRGRSIAQ